MEPRTEVLSIPVLNVIFNSLLSYFGSSITRNAEKMLKDLPEPDFFGSPTSTTSKLYQPSGITLEAILSLSVNFNIAIRLFVLFPAEAGLCLHLRASELI